MAAVGVTAPAGSSTRTRNTLGVALLKLTIACSILWWLIGSGRLDLARLWSLQNGAALAAVIVCKLLSTTIPAVRWHVMTRALGLKISLARAIHIGLIGNFFNAALPGMLGQDAARFAYGRTNEPGREARLLSSMLADRFVGLAALIGLGVVLAPWSLASAKWTSISRMALPALLTMLLVFVVVASLSRVDSSFLRRRLWGPMQSLGAALTEYGQHPGPLTVAIALSAAGHLANFAGFYFGFLTLGLNPALLPVLALSPLVTFVRGLPTTPMGLGIADWAGEALYASIHLADGAEVVMLNRIVTFGIAAACGFLFLVPMRRQRRG